MPGSSWKRRLVSVSMIRDVRKAVGEIPVILTCRGHWEGGFKKVSDEAKFALYREAAAGGLVDFLDMELAYGDEKSGKPSGCLRIPLFPYRLIP